MDSMKACMLKAAFTGNNDKLLTIIKQLYQEKVSGKKMENVIMEYIELSTSHSSPEIASVSSKIIALNNTNTTKNISNNNNHRNGHSQKTEKKKKKTTTQKVVDSIEIKLNQCLNTKSKLNEAIIFSIIDFLYKSLESIKMGKSFEKITFNSKYICTVFSLLIRIMSKQLLPFPLFNKKNPNNLSLNDIITNVINKNITISDKINSNLYKQNIKNIKIEIQSINDCAQINKLMCIYKQICDKNKSNLNADNILIKLCDDYKNGIIILNTHIFNKIKPLIQCIENIATKQSKSLLIEWDKYKPKSGKKRRERDMDKISKPPPPKRQRKNSPNMKPMRKSMRKSMIRDRNTDSESESDDIFQGDIYGNESEDDSLSGDERDKSFQMRQQEKFIKNKEMNKQRIEKRMSKTKKRRKSSLDLSDSPSLSPLSDNELNKNKKSKQIKTSNNKTKQILDKFITAYEAKRNIMIWLTSLKAMNGDQLSIIKNDPKFSKYLTKLKKTQKYRQICVEILRNA